MSDLISRRAAITIPVTPKEDREYQTYNLDDAYERGWEDLEKRIEQLPSVQSETCAYWDRESDFCALHKPSAQSDRKKGKWIRNNNGTYSCSLCQSWIPNEQHYYARYCLFCGAKMDGEENEANAECESN